MNIVSLGAGFDTLFFRLLETRQFASNVAFTEVDCDAIADAKAKQLNNSDIRAGFFPKDAAHLSVAAPSAEKTVAWQCHVPSASYAIIACDLGDIYKLDAMLDAAGVDRSLPTLILAECVVVQTACTAMTVNDSCTF